MHARNPHGLPDRIVERVDPPALRQIALRRCSRVLEAEDIIRRLDALRQSASTLHDAATTTDAKDAIEGVMQALDNALEDAASAKAALEEEITPEMEAVL
ncbi:hypothetical protein [Thalassobaculum sp.]|uniref:hypothetical protein n=1 Tax=Thalassobaculum sp. TaxID=2022740 RepID=UPI0032EDC4A9